MTTPVEISGLRVLITGAARGIGAETARLLAARGARLSLVDLDEAGVRSLAAELGGGALPLGADVRRLDDMERVAEAAAARHGGIDVVLANAGVAYGSEVAATEDDLESVTLDVNVLGVMRTVRATLPRVLESRGQYVLISSLASQVQLPLLAAYSASKAAVHAYGNSLRGELRHRGVAVTVAYFGFIDTDMGRLAGDSRTMASLTRRLPGPLSRLHPVSSAAAALVRGMETRSRRVVHPRAVLPAVLLPALHQAVTERFVRDGVAEALRIAAGEESIRQGSTPGLAGGGGRVSVLDGLAQEA